MDEAPRLAPFNVAEVSQFSCKGQHLDQITPKVISDEKSLSKVPSFFEILPKKESLC